MIRYHELSHRLLELEFPELRGNGKNYIKGEGGKFAGSRPGSGSGAAASASESYGIPKKPTLTMRLTSTKKSGKIPLDKKGKPFKYPSVDIPEDEYNNFIHNVNTYYRGRYEGKRICTYYSGLYSKSYHFENHGYGDYNIYNVGDLK